MHIAFYREVKEFTQEIVNLHLGLYNRYFPYWESSGSMGSPNEMMA